LSTLWDDKAFEACSEIADILEPKFEYTFTNNGNIPYVIYFVHARTRAEADEKLKQAVYAEHLEQDNWQCCIEVDNLRCGLCIVRASHRDEAVEKMLKECVVVKW